MLKRRPLTDDMELDGAEGGTAKVLLIGSTVDAVLVILMVDVVRVVAILTLEVER